MHEQGTARRGGTTFIWKWGAICGAVLGAIQIIISLLVALELGLGAGIGALGCLVGRRQAPPVASTPVAGTVWTPPPSAQ